MRNELEKFHETVGILVKAYLEGTLRHGDCAACAVGNILKSDGWNTLFFTDANRGLQYDQTNSPFRYWFKNKERALVLIHESGYSIKELMRVEYAFEMVDRGDNRDDYMFNGLMAVVDVLAEIHGIDLTVKEESKKLFVKI